VADRNTTIVHPHPVRPEYQPILDQTVIDNWFTNVTFHISEGTSIKPMGSLTITDLPVSTVLPTIGEIPPIFMNNSVVKLLSCEVTEAFDIRSMSPKIGALRVEGQVGDFGETFDLSFFTKLSSALDMWKVGSHNPRIGVYGMPNRELFISVRTGFYTGSGESLSDYDLSNSTWTFPFYVTSVDIDEQFGKFVIEAEDRCGLLSRMSYQQIHNEFRNTRITRKTRLDHCLSADADPTAKQSFPGKWTNVYETGFSVDVVSRLYLRAGFAYDIFELLYGDPYGLVPQGSQGGQPYGSSEVDKLGNRIPSKNFLVSRSGGFSKDDQILYPVSTVGKSQTMDCLKVLYDMCAIQQIRLLPREQPSLSLEQSPFSLLVGKDIAPMMVDGNEYRVSPDRMYGSPLFWIDEGVSSSVSVILHSWHVDVGNGSWSNGLYKEGVSPYGDEAWKDQLYDFEFPVPNTFLSTHTDDVLSDTDVFLNSDSPFTIVSTDFWKDTSSNPTWHPRVFLFKGESASFENGLSPEFDGGRPYSVQKLQTGTVNARYDRISTYPLPFSSRTYAPYSVPVNPNPYTLRVGQSLFDLRSDETMFLSSSAVGWHVSSFDSKNTYVQYTATYESATAALDERFHIFTALPEQQATRYSGPMVIGVYGVKDSPRTVTRGELIEQGKSFKTHFLSNSDDTGSVDNPYCDSAEAAEAVANSYFSYPYVGKNERISFVCRNDPSLRVGSVVLVPLIDHYVRVLLTDCKRELGSRQTATWDGMVIEHTKITTEFKAWTIDGSKIAGIRAFYTSNGDDVVRITRMKG
jgi:hypothetical protein